MNWINQHYGGIFKEVHFGNHFALEGEARSKSEICRYLTLHSKLLHILALDGQTFVELDSGSISS